MARAVLIDRGWMQIKSDIRELQGQGVKVGIRSSAGEHDGILIVDYATFNEFGTSTIPARPFMRRTADLSYIVLPRFSQYLTQALINRKITVSQLMNRLGLFYQNMIKDTIRSTPSWAVPNSPITIKRKKSSVPLIDTGTMLNSVDYERTRI